MSIFTDLKVYDVTPWTLTGSAKLSKADAKLIAEATVVESEFGLSAKVLLVKGGYKYIPISRDSVLAEGDDIEPSSIVLLTLEKEGQPNITRLDVE